MTLDIVMPDTDGIYALEHILQFDPDAKIVVVSALNQTRLISEAIRKGAQDFIAKPFLPEQLQRTMESCCEQLAQALIPGDRQQSQPTGGRTQGRFCVRSPFFVLRSRRRSRYRLSRAILAQ